MSSVRRDGEQAVLFIADECAKKDDGGDVPPPFKVGDKPVQKIDWTKRFDHMQQHSGQHLITAIALKLFNLETTSWYLGVDSSFIEMDAKEISDETMEVIEEKVNEKIRERVDVLVTYREPDNLGDVRFRMDVPEALRGGPVRVVEISDVDKNTCCGTHVVNLGDLQAIKLLGTAKGNKGKTQLHFVAGGRVLKYLGLAVKREKSLTALLKCTPENLEPMVDKAQKTVKRLHKVRARADYFCQATKLGSFYFVCRTVSSVFVISASWKRNVFFKHQKMLCQRSLHCTVKKANLTLSPLSSAQLALTFWAVDCFSFQSLTIL